jgi:phenylacetate-CoA ligase
VTKDAIRQQPIEHLTADNVDLTRCWSYRTSGTTGVPFTVYWEKKPRLLSSPLSHYVNQLACGDKITHRRIALAPFTASPPGYIQRFGIFPTKHLSPFEDPQTQLKHIRAFNPHSIICTPSSIVQIAQALHDHPFPALRIARIFTGGEYLDARTRRYLKDTFQAPIYDGYGAMEVGTIGLECPHHALHVNSHAIIVEITRKDESVAPDEEGDVTVTNLYNYAQPALRYNLGDIGRILSDACPCGNPAPILEITQGRNIDLIQRPNHEPISVNEVCSLLSFLNGIKQFQVQQNTRDTLTILVVPDANFTPTQCHDIRLLVRGCVGSTLDVHVTLVDQIPRTPAGKLARFKTTLA